MSFRVYMKIEVAIDIVSDNKDTAERAARDALYDELPDSFTENIIDMDALRIVPIAAE